MNSALEQIEFSYGESVPLESLSDYQRDVCFYQKRKKERVRFVHPPKLPGPVADTHAHLDMISNAPLALARCAYYGVSFICTIMDVKENPTTTYAELDAWQEEAACIYHEYELGNYQDAAPHVRFAIGCHPHNAKFYDDALEQLLEEKLRDTRVAAIGEIGLDYYYDNSPREDQREAFRRQIRLAHKTGFPVILHLRDAHEDGLNILNEEGFPEAGVLLHCFNLDTDTLKPWVEKGCYVAFGGPLTFNNTPEVRKSALEVPEDRLLTETDSPFMTPVPLRGIECGPEFTIFTAAKMLEIYNCQTSEQQKEMLDALYNNALGLLDRGPTPWQNG